MTIKMAEWQIDKVLKMHDLSVEILTGVSDSLDYLEKNDIPVDPEDMVITDKLIDICANNLELCEGVVERLKLWLKQEYPKINVAP